MRRAVLAVCGAPAWASDSAVLVREINDLAGTRFDISAYDARQKAVLAARLHAEGDHDSARKLACQGLWLLGATPESLKKKNCPSR